LAAPLRPKSPGLWLDLWLQGPCSKMLPKHSRPQAPTSKGEHEDGNSTTLHLMTESILGNKGPDTITPKTRDHSSLDSVSLESENASLCGDSSAPGRGTRLPRGALSSRPLSSLRVWRSELARRWRIFWAKNRSVCLVFFSQLFGALMNLAARLLELEGEGLDPFQILFFRQGLTALLASVYMYRTQVPDFPFGSRDVRLLLIARGLSGFFGKSKSSLSESKADKAAKEYMECGIP
jgi:hypothetical protein